ncbi:MAG TPA: VTT domain-containing protein [Candidatus Dormibacteraeota bacterium]|nr:VTT domain-containing protein [Candidatus Dormibacteraeota bacterium]
MLNIANIIQSHSQLISLLIISAIIFTESGIPIGFFLPGDTLLFTAGFFASQRYINIVALIIVVIIAKILGGVVGYYIGDQTGRKLFTKKDSLFFRKDYLESAEVFYRKHGGKAVVLGQFVPIVRTFSPVVAGFSEMFFKSFMFFNFLGAFIWAVALPLLGYWLGHRITNIDKYILPIVALAVIGTLIPIIWHLFIGRKKKAKSTDS